MNERAVIGDNRAPDPIDEALAPFGDYIAEAEGWLDGEPVSTEGQMKDVDALLKHVKAAKKAVDDAEKSACLPLHDAWKAEKDRWKPTITDLDRIAKGLASIVNDFKKRLAAEREEERRKAEAEARRKREEAERKAREASAGDIEAQRAADAAMEDAKAAMADAKSVETVKGLRTVTRYEIDDYRKLLHWIAVNDRDAVTDFIEDYARRNHKSLFAASTFPDGLRIWQDKEAF